MLLYHILTFFYVHCSYLITIPYTVSIIPENLLPQFLFNLWVVRNHGDPMAWSCEVCVCVYMCVQVRVKTNKQKKLLNGVFFQICSFIGKSWCGQSLLQGQHLLYSYSHLNQVFLFWAQISSAVQTNKSISSRVEPGVLNLCANFHLEAFKSKILNSFN